ncbi:MAG TPA: hypothetical protein VIY72_07845 [Acidimicrobiales bacterium]
MTEARGEAHDAVATRTTGGLAGTFGPGGGLHQALRTRPPLSVVGVLAAVAGALLAVATITIIGVSDDPSPWLLVVLSLALVVVGWGAATAFQMRDGRDGLQGRLVELVPLGSVMVALAAPALAVGVIGTQVIDATDSPSSSLVWWPTALVALVLLALWALPGLQGRPVLLAEGLLMATWSLAGLVAVQLADQPSRRMYTYDEEPFFASPFAWLGNLSDAYRAASIAAFAAGVAFLLLAALADRFELPRLGSPLIVAGVVAGAIGASGVFPDQAVLRALVPLLLLVLVIGVGMIGGRKATTWFGALFSVGFVVQLCVALLGDDPSAGLAAALIGLFGLLVLVGALALAATSQSPRPRDTAPPVPPAAPIPPAPPVSP